MKKEFRKKVIESRKNKSANFVLSNSNLITEKLLQMEDIRNATNIMLYLNFNNEVQTDNLIKKLLSLKKIVSSPITIKENHTLIPILLHARSKVAVANGRDSISPAR